MNGKFPDESWYQRPNEFVKFTDIPAKAWFIRNGKTDMVFQKTTTISAQGYCVSENGTLTFDDVYRFAVRLPEPAEFEIVTIKVTIEKI